MAAAAAGQVCQAVQKALWAASRRAGKDPQLGLVGPRGQDPTALMAPSPHRTQPTVGLGTRDGGCPQVHQYRCNFVPHFPSSYLFLSIY